MYKWFLLFTSLLFSSNSFADVNIKLACEEKEEQKQSLLTRLSTSVTEAHLAGQCTGYYSHSRISFRESCSEFIEQKKSLLSFSTSLKEAYLAGTCIGAIYKTAQDCDVDTYSINYQAIADGASSLSMVEQRLGCYGNRYGW
ncbi:hypothetical protein OW492_12275 [Psychromonas sp. 14N.309.X.WAT.B.A12]|uniref:hypothetical protein n=1 Tax=Psychromonas sp. 14N.309.X.WAT.B.A12 TaxID=2998322 RepID=UPI0025B03C42|nr:hypothetical protein [Psychromonas sp. 14N.309.X.WAT.B.A12]MDN2664150.1 hypothetical protein [Psychromonas sp. 14N.309.X.WAT.B.A12]